MNRQRRRICALLILLAFLGMAGIGVQAQGVTSSFYIESSPSDASVYIQGVYKGETPLEVPGVYPPGRYPVTVQKTGYVAWHTSGVVVTGTQTRISATLTPQFSTLTVTSRPAGAMIILDGSDAGTTPATFDPLQAGTHSLKLVLIGYEDWVSTIDLLPNQPVTIDAQLGRRVTPYRGTLTIQSSPSRAEVAIDGDPRGETPITLTDLPPGTRAVRLTLDGYEPWESEVQIDESSPAQLTATLTPLPAPTPAGPGLAVLAAATSLLAAALLNGRRKD